MEKAEVRRNPTLEDIEGMDKEFLTAVDVAPFIGVDPQDMRTPGRIDPLKLGFPIVITGTRVRIPRRAFCFFIRYGHCVIQSDYSEAYLEALKKEVMQCGGFVLTERE